MQGKNTITDNQGNGNVYLSDGSVITVTGSLAGSNIGVTMEDEIGTFTSGYKKNNSDVDPATIFKADNAVVFVPALSGDEAALTLQQLVKAASDADLRTAASFDGANIQLANDIKMSNSTLVIGENKTVTLDLNGKTLDRGLTSRDFDHGGQVITVRKGGTLNLSNGTLTGGYGGNGGGIANEEGTATLTDVTITGCTGDQRGGGISNAGTLTMTGGSLTNNTSNDIKASSSDQTAGGGLFNFKGATATLTGVTITGNKNKTYGGGGICNFGTLNIDGGTITGNTAGANGGAIWQEGTLNLQGKNTITDNQAGGKANNVYLYNTVITVTGSLEGSKIGIRMEKPDVFTSGYSTNNKDVSPVTIFVSDDSDYKVVASDNEAKLVKNMETAVKGIEDAQGKVEGIWYDLNGRQFNSMPAAKGIYLNNGRKVVVK
jgi:adhesin HecA-like repeat protein